MAVDVDCGAVISQGGGNPRGHLSVVCLASRDFFDLWSSCLSYQRGLLGSVVLSVLPAEISLTCCLLSVLPANTSGICGSVCLASRDFFSLLSLVCLASKHFWDLQFCCLYRQQRLLGSVVLVSVLPAETSGICGPRVCLASGDFWNLLCCVCLASGDVWDLWSSCLSCQRRLLESVVLCLSCQRRLLESVVLCLSCQRRLLESVVLCLSCQRRLLESVILVSVLPAESSGICGPRVPPATSTVSGTVHYTKALFLCVWTS